MKKTRTLVFLLVIALCLLGCDGSHVVPEDIHRREQQHNIELEDELSSARALQRILEVSLVTLGSSLAVTLGVLWLLARKRRREHG